MKLAKCISFKEIIEDSVKKQTEAVEKFTKNGGICLNCEKEPGETNSTLNPMHCKKCNEKTEKILKQLRGPGFVELKM